MSIFHIKKWFIFYDIILTGDGGVGGELQLTSSLAHHSLMPGDDLRAYAYEGDSSSGGSLSSALSGD